MAPVAGERGNRLERGVNVLQAFRPDGRPLRLTDIATRVGLAKSTTHRLVTELQQLGLLEREGDRYVLGREVFELAELVPLRVSLREAALPYMQDLFKATQGTVHLAVRHDLDALYVERIRGHRGVSVPSRVGGRLPLSSTGVGKVLLAYAEPGLVDEVTSRPLRRLTEYSVTDPQVLRQQLKEVRVHGFGFDIEEAAVGVGCVAAPVLQLRRAVASVSVSVPVAPGDDAVLQRLAPAVRMAAAGISRTLRASDVSGRG